MNNKAKILTALLAIAAGTAWAVVETERRTFNGTPALSGHSFDSATGNSQGDNTGAGDEPRNMAVSEDGVLLFDPSVWDSTYVAVAQTSAVRIDQVAYGTAPVHVGAIVLTQCATPGSSGNPTLGIYDADGGSTSTANVRFEMHSSTTPANTLGCHPRTIPLGLRLTTGLSIMNLAPGTGGTAAQWLLLYRHSRNTK